jgi:two-component system sensor histidine kinase BaeS
MLHSLRFRLLAALVVLPVAALAGVWIATSQVSRLDLDSQLKFRVVPLTRSSGGPSTGKPEDFQISTSGVQSVAAGTQPIIYDPGDGNGFLIRAEPEFVDAFRRDQESSADAVQSRLAIALVVAAVAAIVIALAFWRRILRPIERLTGAARDMERGNLAGRVEVQGNDEVGALGAAFNSMAAALERDATLRKTMTSDIAHELRTPLNNLSGYLDAIADGVVEPGPGVVASLQEEASALTRLVTDLEQLALAEAGYQQLVFEPVDLGAIAGLAADAVRARAAAREVALDVAAERQVIVLGDATRLRQVVRNLLDNAITHTPPGGEIIVRTGAEAGSAVIAVSDSGPGIAEEHAALIFERFYRVDPARARDTGGAGLGLAIVRQLVEAHRGTISVTAAQSGGALFEVRIPLAGAAPRPAPAPLAVQRL